MFIMQLRAFIEYKQQLIKNYFKILIKIGRFIRSIIIFYIDIIYINLSNIINKKNNNIFNIIYKKINNIFNIIYKKNNNIFNIIYKKNKYLHL